MREEIEKANSRFSEGFAKGDASITSSGYAEDAVVFPPDGEVVRGKKSIQRFWQEVMGSGVKEARLLTAEVFVGGNYAHEMGTGILTVQSKEGEVTRQSVKYVVVWELTDDGWKNKWDIWNGSP